MIRKNEQDDRPGYSRRMTGEEINRCPLRRWEGPVHLVRSMAGVEDAIRRLERERVLGFDTETRPAFKKGRHYPPSLLQLAGEEAVFLFQLVHLGLPESMRRLLARPDIVKAGVSLDYDLRELQKVGRFEPAGFVGLGTLARELGIRNHGLRGLAAVVLGFRISKGARTTNWANRVLTPAQMRYAATDAWVGRELYLRLRERKPSKASL